MVNSPWTITSKKRTRTPALAPPRKRARTSNDVSKDTDTKSEGREIEQSTLTQIDFVKSSSIAHRQIHGQDFEYLEDAPAQVRPQSAKRTLKKRDSTLTQLDFIKNISSSPRNAIQASGSMPNRDSPIDTGVQPRRSRLKKRDSTLTQMDFLTSRTDTTNDLDDSMLEIPETGSATREPSIPAFDGAYSDPPLSYSAMTPQVFRPARVSESAGMGKRDSAEEHQPHKRRRLQANTSTPKEANRRRSGRLAATPAPVAEPSTAEERTLNPRSITKHSRRSAASTKRPPLVIQDSTDFVEQEVPPLSKLHGLMPPPATPTKNRDRIPSSQSPESIGPSTRKRYTNRRTPLASLSTNVQVSPSKASKSSKLVGKSPFKRSPPRKICVLKVPSKALLARTRQVDDAQHDIWSVQATSSPSRENNSPEPQPPMLIRTWSPTSKSEGTTQATKSQIAVTAAENIQPPQEDIDTQKSLPGLAEILGIKQITKPQPFPAQASGELPVSDIHDEHEGEGLAHVSEGGEVSVNMIPELEQVSSDDLSDFGSPVPNDTQFVRDLIQRTSSPPLLAETQHLSPRHSAVHAQAPSGSPQAKAFRRTRISATPSKPSPLPPPRLVTTSPAQVIQTRIMRSSTQSLPSDLTQGQPKHKPSGRVVITQVPLNDTHEHQKQSSSSSPALPNLPSSVHKSAHLASIPHPSQVSTQAPSTQGYLFPYSSAPNSYLLPQHTEIEMVTVRDSSSVPAHMSQIQQHALIEEVDEEGQIRLVDDSQDDDELDLDPSTWKKASSKSRPGTQLKLPSSQDPDITQSPTQKSRTRSSFQRHDPGTQSSPIVTNATTRSQRNAKLEIIELSSSSQLEKEQQRLSDEITPRPRPSTTTVVRDFAETTDNPQSPPSSSLSSSNLSPSPARPLRCRYSPIPGFDNDTQSDFTQNGHITAAYIHRMREDGLVPKTYVPKNIKPKNWAGRYDG